MSTERDILRSAAKYFAGETNVTYVTPVVGVLLGILILGERLSWNQPLGALLVIAGIMLTRRT